MVVKMEEEEALEWSSVSTAVLSTLVAFISTLTVWSWMGDMVWLLVLSLTVLKLNTHYSDTDTQLLQLLRLKVRLSTWYCFPNFVTKGTWFLVTFYPTGKLRAFEIIGRSGFVHEIKIHLESLNLLV